MECPLCLKEIPGLECPSCNKNVPEKSKFCMECGSNLSSNAPSTYDPLDDENMYLEDRELCPDGTCTGIIIDGRCCECDLPG